MSVRDWFTLRRAPPAVWRWPRFLAPAHARFGPHEMIARGNRSDAVSLTFDDGPDPRWTPAVLRILEEKGVRATFFLVGSQMLAHPDLTLEIAASHEVGTHLFTHRRGLVKDRRAFQDDLERALEAHDRVLGARPRWLRFPFGDVGCVPACDWTVRGLVGCHWSVNSQDVCTDRPERIVRQIFRSLSGGDIILLHDGMARDSRLGPGHRDATVAALPIVLDKLCACGLDVVAVGG